MADSGDSRESGERLTSREACQGLGITRPILRKWCKRLGITTAQHEWDRRYWTLAPAEVARIREARAKMPTPASTAPSRRAALAPRPPDPAPASAPALPVVSVSECPHALPRRARPTVPLSRRALPPLPEGATRLPELERRYGCPSTTVKMAIAKGILANAEGGPWASGGPQAIHYALAPDQVEVAVRRYGGRAKGQREGQRTAGQEPPGQP